MDVVTGSFGYIGKYITRQLLAGGREVRTITTHPAKPNPFGNQVQAFSYNFTDPAALVSSLAGAETLFNTYWIRFEYAGQTYAQALENTRLLFTCARQAGVRKIIHISVTNASLDSDLPYYHGKAVQEKMLAEAGVDYAIVRPTLVFGKEDILVNNIAWLIRKFPFFPIFGGGDYHLQPVFVEDLARIAVGQIKGESSVTLDAIGPEKYSFLEFIRLLADKLGRNTRLVHLPPRPGISLGKVIGTFLGDVLLTENELRGLMEEYLTSTQVPNGTTRFSTWLEENKTTIGSVYSSEIGRHFKWRPDG
jgi:NADH dehydrogenase